MALFCTDSVTLAYADVEIAGADLYSSTNIFLVLSTISFILASPLFIAFG